MVYEKHLLLTPKAIGKRLRVRLLEVINTTADLENPMIAKAR